MQRRRVCVLLFILTCFSIPAEGATSKLPFSLVVRERFGTIGVGDLNTTLSSFNSGYDHIRSRNVPWAVVGEISPISGRFKEWEAELQWDFWWGFSIGFAVSAPAQYGGMSVLTFSIMNDGLNQTIINTFTSNIRVSAPLMFTLYKSINLIHNVRASIDGGIGFYRAQMTQRHLYHGRYPMEDVRLTKRTFDVRGRDLGYHLGIALEYRFNQRISMIADGQWRFAKITTFKGVGILETQEFDADGVLFFSDSISTDGVLYHYVGQDLNNGERVEKLVVSDLVPPWYGVDFPDDIRNANLDLGGFTLKIGLRIGLF